MAGKKKIDIGYSEETRLALLEQSISHINETMQRFDKRFDRIDAKFDQIDARFEQMNSRFQQMDSKIDSHFHWMVGLMFGLYAMGLTGLISALGKAYGWF
jgi:uncharacterized coiled-coil protein SlyX